jgi:hypothetical protein
MWEKRFPVVASVAAAAELTMNHGNERVKNDELIATQPTAPFVTDTNYALTRCQIDKCLKVKTLVHHH